MLKRKLGQTEIEKFNVTDTYCSDINAKPDIYRAKNEFNTLFSTRVRGMSYSLLKNIEVNRGDTIHSGVAPRVAIISVSRKLDEIINNSETNITLTTQEACVLQLALKLRLNEELLDSSTESSEVINTDNTTVVDLTSQQQETVVADYNPIQFTISNDEITIRVPTSNGEIVTLPEIAQTTLANLLNLDLVDRSVKENPNEEFLRELENLYFDILKTIREYITSIRTNLGRNDILLSSTVVFAYHMFRHIVKYLWLMNNRYNIVGCALTLSFRILNLILSWIGYIFVILLNNPWGVMFLFLSYLYFAWTCPGCNAFIMKCLWILNRVPNEGPGPIFTEILIPVSQELYQQIINFLAGQAIITINAIAAPFMAMYVSVNQNIRNVTEILSDVVETASENVGHVSQSISENVGHVSQSISENVGHVTQTINEITEPLQNSMFVSMFVVQDNLQLMVDPEYKMRRVVLLQLLLAMRGEFNIIDTIRLPDTPNVLSLPYSSNSTANSTALVVSNRPVVIPQATPRQQLNQYIFNLTHDLPVGNLTDIITQLEGDPTYTGVDISFEAVANSLYQSNYISISRTFDIEARGYISSPITQHSNLPIQLSEMFSINTTQVTEYILSYITPTLIGLSQNIPLLTTTIEGNEIENIGIAEQSSTAMTPARNTISNAFTSFKQTFKELIIPSNLFRGRTIMERIGIFTDLLVGDTRSYFTLFDEKVADFSTLNFQNITECPSRTFEEIDGGSRKRFTKKRSKKNRSNKKSKKSSGKKHIVSKSHKNKKSKKRSMRRR